MSKRVLEFKGIRNFRDLGGYSTSDGKSVRWGIIYRSGSLHEATDEDLQRLSALGVRTVIDLRDSEAVERHPDRVSDKLGINVIHHPMLTPAMTIIIRTLRLAGQGLSGEDIDVTKLRTDSAKSVAIECAPQIKAVIEVLSDPNNIPAVFHCTGGKDRTGYVAAVILTALGVPYKEVLQDYLLTNSCIKEWVQELLVGHPEPKLLKKFLECRENVLEAYFQALKLRHGSVEAFMSNELGLTENRIEAMRRAFLAEVH